MSDKKPTGAGAGETGAGGNTPATRLLQALEQLVTSVVGEQLRGMLESADEILFEMAQKAKNNNEQRLYLDTMRVIRLERPHLLRAFQDSLRHTFADVRLERAASNIDLDDLDSWSVQGADETEEKVTVANLETKAETIYQQEIFELENRLESLAQRTNASISTKMISPGRIFNAFRDTMRGLDVEFPIKLVIYRLAERTLLGNLREVYTGANRMLADQGYEPMRGRSGGKPTMPPRMPGTPGPTPPPSPGSSGIPAGAMPPGMGMPSGGGIPPGMGMPQGGGYGSPPPSGNPGFDPSRLMAALTSQLVGGDSAPPQPMQTMPGAPTGWHGGIDTDRLVNALAMHGPGSGGGRTLTDADLASELANSLQSLSQGRTPASWIPVPNLTLVGKMFDGFYQDPRLPEEFRSLLGRLQYPVMKTALADPTFFRNPDHPVRGLVHDVFDMLTSTSKAEPEDVRRLSELIDHLLREFEVEAARLSKPEGRAPAVSEPDAEAFLQQQEKRMANNRTRSVEKVRRLVAQELRLRTAHRRIPQGIMPLLLSGFGPMLAVHFLRGGVEGEGWKNAIQLLERMLDSLDGGPELSAEARATRETEVIGGVSSSLTDAGLAPDKVERLVEGLIDTYRSFVETPPVPEAAVAEPADLDARAKADARQALSAILTPGSWFKIWDPVNQQQRWLKLNTYFPAQDTVLFGDFSGDNQLKMRAATLARDLMAGRSEPVDPGPAVRRSLTMLAPLKDEFSHVTDTPAWLPSSATAPPSQAIH